MMMALVLVVSLASSNQFHFDRTHSDIFVQNMPADLHYRFTSESETSLKIYLTDKFSSEAYFHVNQNDRIYSVSQIVHLEPDECTQLHV